MSHMVTNHYIIYMDHAWNQWLALGRVYRMVLNIDFFAFLFESNKCFFSLHINFYLKHKDSI